LIELENQSMKLPSYSEDGGDKKASYEQTATKCGILSDKQSAVAQKQSRIDAGLTDGAFWLS
jgi:hypothetical protein